MNDIVILLLLAAGAILIYSAVKDKNPADLIRDTLGGNNA